MSSTNIPSNEEITSVVKNAEEAIEDTKKHEKRLTRQGKDILNTTEQLLQDTTRLIDEKNPDDLIQRIFQEAHLASEELQTNQIRWNEIQGALKGLKSNELRDRLNRVYETAKFMALELITSQSFRQSIYDFFAVLYSTFVDASQIEKIGEPLRDAIERMKKQHGEGAGEKLKEAAEETVRRVIDYKDPQKPFLATENLTREQTDELVDRAYLVLKNISERERSQRLISNLIEVWDLMREPLEALVKSVEETTEQVSEKMETEDDSHTQEVFRLSQQLFEKMTGRSMDTLLSHLRVLYRSIIDDPELKAYFSRLREFAHQALEDKTKAVKALTEEQTRKEIRKLIEDGRRLVQKKEGKAQQSMRENLRALTEEVQQMIYALEEDPLAKAIQEDISKLVKQVLLDEQGRITFKPEVLDQLRVIAVSLVLRRLRFPLPPLSFGNEDPNATLVFTVSGMVLNIEDLLPKQIVAENQGLAILNFKTPESPKVKTATEAVRIVFKNINVHLPNAYLKFDYRGFPAVQDEGRASIDVGGRGMDISVILESRIGSDRMLNLAKVDVTIHELDLKLEGTRHDTLYNAFVTLFKPRIKTHIENAIEESMIAQFEYMNDQLELQAKNLRNQIASTAQTATKTLTSK